VSGFREATNRFTRGAQKVSAFLGRVSSVFIESGKVSVEGHEEDREVDLAAPYGVCGMPPVGTDVQVIANWGSKHQLVVVGSVVSVKELEPGESALYSQGGARVYCRVDGTVVVNEGDKPVARVGDRVEVNVGGQTVTGIIVSGNEKFLA
jgi:phage gp45-like